MENKIGREDARKLASLYKSQLGEIMEEWAEHTEDMVNGGYITDYGADWKLISLRKNIWAQARQTYMFAAYYECLDQDDRWLSLAKRGRDFLTAHAYAGNGRWNYEVSGDGSTVVEGTTTIFTDLFALIALAQYAAVSGDRSDEELIRETFDHAKQNVMDPKFRDIKPHVWKEEIDRHSPYMIAIHSSMIAEKVLGKETTGPFIEFCVNKLLHFFGENESGFLLESLRRDRTLWDTAEGRLVNPGHIFEGMWFCIDYARSCGDKKTIREALDIIKKTAGRAIDPKYGGVIHRFDCSGKPGKEALKTDTGELKADNKVDWVNCESLYAFALDAVLTEDEASVERFWQQHLFCQKYFRPTEGGDWYPVLERDGKPIRRNKGGMHRVAFHVPRALMNLCLLFEAECSR